MTQGVALNPPHPRHDYMMFVLPRKWRTDIFPISPAGRTGRCRKPLVSYWNSACVAVVAHLYIEYSFLQPSLSCLISFKPQ